MNDIFRRIAQSANDNALYYKIKQVEHSLLVKAYAELEAENKALREAVAEAVDLISWSFDWANCTCGHPAHKEDRYVQNAKTFMTKHDCRSDSKEVKDA